MKKLISKLKKDENGQAMVEFALILPLLLSILCGILDFGWFYLNEYEVNHATYEGARYAALNRNLTTDDILVSETNNIIRANLNHYTDTSLDININGLEGNYPSITVSNRIPMLTFVGGTIMGNDYTITVTNSFYTDLPEPVGIE